MQVEEGDTVVIHFTCLLEDGTLFDSTFNRKPLKFTVGDGSVIKGLDELVIGMVEGQVKSGIIPAEKAFGPYYEDRIHTVNINSFPEGIKPEVGLRFEYNKGDGNITLATIKEISDSTVTIDENHPLAGKNLFFEVLLVEILEKNPQQAEELFIQGVKAQNEGKLEEAISLYNKALRIKPDLSKAYYNIGVIYQEKGIFDKAIFSYKLALSYKYDYTEAYHNIGVIYWKLKNFEEAISNLMYAINFNPFHALSYYHLGVIYQELGQIKKATNLYERALQIDPTLSSAYFNLGVIHQDKEEYDFAIERYKKALEYSPENFGAYNNLGLCYLENENLDDAMASFQKSIELKPDFAEAYSNIGNVYHNKLMLDEAINMYKKAIDIDPNYTDAHWNLAISYLLKGELEQGWKEYEWRWKTDEFHRPSFPKPIWNGEPIHGKKLLIITEQGLGDALQFLRYIPLIYKKGVKIIFTCSEELIPLIKNHEEISEIIPRNSIVPEFDYYCSLLSLPLIFNTTINNIPQNIPYINATKKSIKYWHNKLSNNQNKMKIGIVWAGNPKHKMDKKRSIPLKTYYPLFDLKGVAFYSLQKGKGSEQVDDESKKMGLIDLTNEINDFSDTAGFIMNLDLVITVDTAVAHLAGALGRPVWVLIPYIPDWRWMLNREDSPWYPTMRLFRQSSRGDWETVVIKIRQELERLISSN
jgi:FKBP-type peptidyl-prolyl cis-trans isomerase 2/TolA-binding protein